MRHSLSCFPELNLPAMPQDFEFETFNQKDGTSCNAEVALR